MPSIWWSDILGVEMGKYQLGCVKFDGNTISISILEKYNENWGKFYFYKRFEFLLVTEILWTFVRRLTLNLRRLIT
jgi:hypothetical protein